MAVRAHSRRGPKPEASSLSSQPNRAGPPATILGHPAGLFVLAATEMWEFFSYYGMRTLLIFYLTQDVRLPVAEASMVYGTFAFASYVTPILGGWLIDRLRARTLAVIAGGLIMAAGHFTLAAGGAWWLGLSAVALGNGLFLPSLAAQVGALYAQADARRDQAYGYYYSALNLGALLAPLVCGWLGETYDWRYGFAAAGVGMLIGVAVCVLGRPMLPPEHSARSDADAARPIMAWRRLWPLALVLALVVLLRGAYEQIGSTVALWVEKDVDRALWPGGFVVPATWFQSLNALTVIVITPLLALYWTRQARRGCEPDEARKMSAGAALMAGAFALIAIAASLPSAAASGWPVAAAFFLVISLGELWVLPIGLALFARRAPPGVVATTIAVWYGAKAFGSLLAGWVGALFEQLAPSGFFWLCAAIAAVCAVGFWLVGPALRREAEPRDA